MTTANSQKKKKKATADIPHTANKADFIPL